MVCSDLKFLYFLHSNHKILVKKNLEHPNIIRLIESIDTAKYVYLVMEFAKGESLH